MSQGSFHTEIDDLDSTLLISYLLTRDLADTILCHPYNSEYDVVGFKRDVFLKCRLLKSWENKVIGFSIKR